MRLIVKKGEFYPRIVEGVADKYAEREFHIPDEESEFEKTYSAQNKKLDIIYKYKQGEKTRYNTVRSTVFIAKNPQSLKGFHVTAKGIIDTEGNLYITNDVFLTHTEILDKLSELGLISQVEQWWRKVPSNFVTVQRIFQENAFHIGISHDIVNPEVEMKTRREWKMPSIKESKKLFVPFFKKAKQKNPQYEFYTKTEKEVYK